MTMQKFLTFGIAAYDDYSGAWATLQSLRLYHADEMERIKILVVDNRPDSHSGQKLAKLVASIPGADYRPFTEWKGAWCKSKVFEWSTTPYTLYADSHVLFPPHAISRLIRYFLDNPDTNDLLQGPVVYNNLVSHDTEFKPVWRGQMFGIWHRNPRGSNPANPPYEIQLQGCGILACRTASWPGIHPLLRGFGGEEGYFHEKFRRRGGRCLCLPFLRWVHRFDRDTPNSPYGLTIAEKLRNYLICGWELGYDTRETVSHFREQFANKADASRIFAKTKLEWERYLARRFSHPEESETASAAWAISTAA